jgi:hypothetical protein
LEFHVVDCGDEEEAQAESAPAVSVAVGDDLEPLERIDDVLASDAFAGDGAVTFLVACGQRILFAAFFRHLRVGVPSLQALVAAVDNGNFRFVGIEPIKVANHVSIAGQSG